MQKANESTTTPRNDGLSYHKSRVYLPMSEKTIGQLLDEVANEYHNSLCIVSVDENVRLTFAEVRLRADKLAAGLKKLGLQKGDRIGVWGPNTIAWYITFFAAARGGFSLVGMNPADQLREIEHDLAKVDVRAVVTPKSFKTQNYVEMLQNARCKCPTLEHIIVATDKHSPDTRRLVDVESLANDFEIKAISDEQNDISPLKPFSMQFTSGTTGRPKATVLSHRSLVNNSRFGIRRSGLHVDSNVICFHLPFFHAFGILFGLIGGLHARATLVLPGPTFRWVTSLDAIVKWKCTVIYGTPTMWIDLIAAQEHINAQIGKIGFGLIGGASASPELFDKIKRILKVQTLLSVYGLTEATGLCFQSLPGEDQQLTGTTVGCVGENLEVQVVGKNGARVPFGTPGELQVRGYSTMIGYWKDEENTDKTLTSDGWLRTGDQFVLESNGYGKIVGRLKEMIIRGGENIFPKEIEDVLHTHPEIMEVHVFGVSDDRMGEEVCAYISLQDGSSLSSDAVIKFCIGKMAHFKIPKYVQFVKDFPKTASGKVKKEQVERLQRQRIPCIIVREPTTKTVIHSNPAKTL